MGVVRGAKIGGRKNSIPCQLFLELYSSLTVINCLVQNGRWIERELRILTVNVITIIWPWHLKRYHTTFVHLKHLSLLKENAQRTDVCICSDPQNWVQSALNQAMQLLVYVWTQVKGQTLHWVKANFLAGGKLHPCDESQMRVDFAIYTLFHVTYFFVWLEVYHLCRVFLTLSHGNQSNCYNIGKCGLDNSLIQQSSTIRKSKAHIAFCISYTYKKMIIKNFLFYSYITPTSQLPLRLSRGCNSNKSDHCLLISLPFNDWCRK